MLAIRLVLTCRRVRQVIAVKVLVEVVLLLVRVVMQLVDVLAVLFAEGTVRCANVGMGGGMAFI